MPLMISLRVVHRHSRLLDLGALLSAAALALLGGVRDSRDAVLAMLGLMLCSTLLMLCATAAYAAGALGGLAWQLVLGTGLYVAFAHVERTRTLGAELSCRCR